MVAQPLLGCIWGVQGCRRKALPTARLQRRILLCTGTACARMTDHWGHKGGTGEMVLGMDGRGGPKEKDPGYCSLILPGCPCSSFLGSRNPPLELSLPRKTPAASSSRGQKGAGGARLSPYLLQSSGRRSCWGWRTHTRNSWGRRGARSVQPWCAGEGGPSVHSLPHFALRVKAADCKVLVG